MKNYNTNIVGIIRLKLEKNRPASRGHETTNMGALSFQFSASDWSSGRESQKRTIILCTKFLIYCFPLKGN